MTYTVGGIALAAAAGLNAYIPLLGLALADRLTDEVELGRPYDVISSTGGIIVLLSLLTIDIILDKIPKIDLVNDLINSAVRPAAGMFLLMAVTDSKGEINTVVAMLLGLVVAAAVHSAKAISRLRITTATNGVANPLISLVEDSIAAMLTLLAIVLPWLALIFLATAGAGLAWLYRVVPNSVAIGRTFGSNETGTPQAAIQSPATVATESRDD